MVIVDTETEEKIQAAEKDHALKKEAKVGVDVVSVCSVHSEVLYCLHNNVYAF